MVTYRSVMFGHILYDDSLTWEEVRAMETRMTLLMEATLEKHGACHIDFTPMGDALLVECVFADMDRERNHSLCGEIIRQFGSGVLGRLLFVDRQMDSAVFYFLGRGKWQEQALSIPGPREALSGWVVRQERKNAAERGLAARSVPGGRDRAGKGRAAGEQALSEKQGETGATTPEERTMDGGKVDRPASPRE